jgi:organic hydroperoxide reductase OsmC/OhrA
MHKEHSYSVKINWTGNLGSGTSGYRAYSRNHEISAVGKPVLPGSSDPNFRGDPARYNPEDLLVSSLSGCHMLWYLHLCSEAGITVVEYEDQATGTMRETADGAGHFEEVTLNPEVLIEGGADLALAESLHERAHHLCFIANSVNFPVHCRPTIRTAD